MKSGDKVIKNYFFSYLVFLLVERESTTQHLPTVNLMARDKKD